MLETLAVFAAMPFLFLVTTGFAPAIVIRRIGDKERFSQLSKLAFVAYCLFPAYTIAVFLSKALWLPPIAWTLVCWFELVLGCFSFSLSLYLHRFANQAYNDAFKATIRKDFPPKKRR